MSRILLTDDPDNIHKKVKNALTDSIPGISYDPLKRPGVSNLLKILSHFNKENKSCDSLAAECAGLSLRGFKELVAHCIIENLARFRSEYKRLAGADQSGILREISQTGAHDARVNAEKTMVKVRNAIGL